MDVTKLKRSGACSDALAWLETQPNAATAWNACERGDWMLWILGKLCKRGTKLHRTVVLAACDCAELSIQYVTTGDLRPSSAIEIGRAHV